MATAKERLRALRSRLGGHARSAARGFKGSALAGGAGVVAEFGTAYARDNIDFFKNAQGNSNYVLPLLVFGAGHFAKRKNHDIGTSLCAVAGYQAAEVYRALSKQKELTTSTTPVTPGAKGIEDAGWGGYGDAGMLTGGRFNSMPETNVTGYEDELPSMAGSASDDSYASSAGMLIES